MKKDATRDTGEGREYLEGKDLSSGENYGRQKAPVLDEQKDAFKFMQIDVDYYTKSAKDLPRKYNHGRLTFRDLEYLNLRENDEYSVLRMYGVTQQGYSVMAHIHNYYSYFYVKLSSHCQQMEITNEMLEELRRNICNAVLSNRNQKQENEGFKQGDPIQHIIVKERASVMYYSDKKEKFLKIFVQQPRYVAQLRQMFEKGIFSLDGQSQAFASVTFESNMPFALRFMIDMDIGGMQWIQVPEGEYIMRPNQAKMSTCQYEIDIQNFDKIEPIPFNVESRIAPLRILSFDIECSAQKGKFPTPKEDPIIQIANIVKIHGESEPIVRNVFTLKSCASIVGTMVYSFNKEADLLTAWRDFVLKVDPDFITGYNTQNFDLPYIIDRAQYLHINNFAKFTRLRHEISKVKDQTLNIKALGTRESKDVNIEGRVQIDMMQVIIRDHKLKSYSLNSVSYHFLKEQKEDVPHKIISDLQNQDEFTRRRLAIYCLKDAYLPLRLMEKLMCVFNLTEMARVTGVPITFLFTRGQQIKVASQLYRKARQLKLVIPVQRVEPSGDKYEGATVIEPNRGFYRDPIATLDFASLYPSIMMAHNLCYSTLVPSKREAELLPAGHVERTPHGDYFIKKEVKKGILPLILEELIAARKQAKKELKEATDPFVKGVLDGRQLALKISANSVYGFTGAQVGQLPCLEISSSVTAYGRQMIEHTKKTVMERYSQANGYEFDSEVIYGDTDSVMVKFGTSDRAEAMRLGKEAADYVSKQFVSPIKLEFEKIYHPYLLMNKKRYAGMYWTNPDKPDKMDSKGIETVRRDNCGLVQNIVQGTLDRLLINFDQDGAIEFCKGMISDLLQNRVDLSLLVITKGLSKKVGDGQQEEGGDDAKTEKEKKTTYNSNQAHVKLAEKMKQRDAASAPTVGDRVAYVMVKGCKGSKAYEQSEDPIFVLENNLPIDFNYYIENQIKQPLLRIFEPMFDSVGKAELTLFSGDHVRNIYVPKIATNKGLGRFTVVKESCMACKNVLPPKCDDVICDKCQPRKKEIYIERNLELIQAEKLYSDLWVQCQRCQQSLHQDILCTSRDCPIFYRRIKAKKNFQELSDQLLKLNEW